MRMRLLADSTHAELLASLHATSFAPSWSSDSMASLLAQPGTFACLAEDESGFILIRVAGGESEVLTLAVRPAARRRGTGLALVREAAERACEQGAQALFLEVGCGNIPAISLYKRLGFIEVGRRKAYYTTDAGQSEDALVLRAALPLARVGNGLQLG